MSIYKQYSGLALMASTAVLLVACAGNPKEVPMLDEANAAYQKANEDPMVAKHAAIELDNAKSDLARANQVWKKGEKKSVVEHYAYISNQRVQTAIQRAAQLDADERIERMKVERQEVQIEARSKEAEVAKQQALELQKQMAELQAKQTERGLVMTLGDVLFDSGESTLAPGATHTIAKIAQFMRQYPEKTALIEGHTDSNGNEDLNFDLSVRRASAVRMALIQQGVDGRRLTTKGFGEALPVASNDSSAGRQQNRRVEIIFGDKVGQVAAVNE